MADTLVISQALNACQSARMMVIEEDEALISIKYCNLSSNGLSCSVSKVVPIALVYSSGFLLIIFSPMFLYLYVFPLCG